jgi:hypothetical protein
MTIEVHIPLAKGLGHTVELTHCERYIRFCVVDDDNGISFLLNKEEAKDLIDRKQEEINTEKDLKELPAVIVQVPKNIKAIKKCICFISNCLFTILAI